MTDLMRKLQAELNELFGAKDKEEAAPVKKNKTSKAIEAEDDDGEEEIVVPKKSKKAEPEEETEEEEEAPKKKKDKITMVHIKAKLKDVLDAKGREAAVGLLEKFDAEKVGDIDEDNYSEFMFEAARALAKVSKDSNISKKKPKVEEEEESDDE